MASLGSRSDPTSKFRSSRRLTITVPETIMQILNERSTREGRSLSNLAAYLLETALKQSGY
jgi:hypothetical protein